MSSGDILASASRDQVNGASRRDRALDPARVAQDAEYASEIYYSVHPTKWLELRPNVQFIHNPGGVHDANDVAVLGLGGDHVVGGGDRRRAFAQQFLLAPLLTSGGSARAGNCPRSKEISAQYTPAVISDDRRSIVATLAPIAAQAKAGDLAAVQKHSNRSRR
jgi:hypothetical protein